MHSNEMTDAYFEFLNEREFPCVAAKAAVAKKHIKCIVAHHMACPANDIEVLEFLYHFIDEYRDSNESYHTAAVIFKEPLTLDENVFDQLLWQRLKALSSLDKNKYKHDTRVDSDPASPNYSFSLKGEALFIVGLHPASHRRSRQFKYPTLVFNPHAEFEKLRKLNRYDKMKEVVRKRDVRYSGSVNPMLKDFGTMSEVCQYSGIEYKSDWTCPL